MPSTSPKMISRERPDFEGDVAPALERGRRLGDARSSAHGCRYRGQPGHREFVDLWGKWDRATFIASTIAWSTMLTVNCSVTRTLCAVSL